MDIDGRFVDTLSFLCNFVVFFGVASHAWSAASRDVVNFGDVVTVFHDFTTEYAICRNVLNIQHHTKYHWGKARFVVDPHNNLACVDLNLRWCIKDNYSFGFGYIPSGRCSSCGSCRSRAGGNSGCDYRRVRRFNCYNAIKVDHCFLLFCPFRPRLHSENVIVPDFKNFMDVHADVDSCFVRELSFVRNFIVLFSIAIHARSTPPRNVNDFGDVVTVLHNFAAEDPVSRNFWNVQRDTQNHWRECGFVIHAHHNLGCIDRNAAWRI